MSQVSGHCLCGAVTWASPGPVRWAGICHCESCRRANSAPMLPFLGVARDGLAITGPLHIRTSSPGVERAFCESCGSPLFYRGDAWPDEIHMMALTLDDPAQFQPEAHYFWAEKLPWVRVDDDLPKYAGISEGEAPLKI